MVGARQRGIAQGGLLNTNGITGGTLKRYKKFPPMVGHAVARPDLAWTSYWGEPLKML